MPGPASKLIIPPISAAGPGTLYQQIIDGLKREVSEGRLAPGTALPSFRGLAEDLMVSGDALPRVGPEMSLRDVLDRLHRSGLDGLPVVEGGALTGIVTRQAVAEAAAAAARDRLRPGGAPVS